MSFGEKLAARELRVRSDLASKKKPSDDYTPSMVDFYLYLQGKPCSDPACAHAFDANKDLFQREVIEALLLVNCDYSSIMAVFELPARVLDIYREMFFDMDNAFRTKLDRISYASTYKPREGAKNMKLSAINMGPECILYTYGALIPSASAQRDLMQKIFMSSAYKAMTMHFNGIETNASKQSTEFAKIMMKAFETLEKFAPQEAATSSEMHQYLLSSMDELITTSEQVNDEDIV